MFILDSLLTGGLRFVFDKIAAAVDNETMDDTALREQLLDAQMRLELGEITDIHVVTDRDTGRPRGFAFVTMATAELAQKAISELDGSVLGNRALRVKAAEDRGGGGGGRRF